MAQYSNYVKKANSSLVNPFMLRRLIFIFSKPFYVKKANSSLVNPFARMFFAVGKLLLFKEAEQADLMMV